MLEPIGPSEWTRVAAAHLLNRAGFGASPAEIDAAAARPPAEVVARLVDYQKTEEHFDPPTWYSDEARSRPDRRELRKLSEEERKKRFQEAQEKQREWMRELRGWWLYRMRYTKRPLQEKLTLFWHGHFATSIEKVRSAYCMYVQNEFFRSNANGNWRALLLGLAQDPAMLIYLDNAQSKKEHPNENFARELMELFSLGEGHYTENDIKEAARAFTGWTLHPDYFQFIERSRAHDDGHKRFIAQSGNLTGSDIIDVIVRQPTSSLFITNKLWEFFAYENPDPALVAALAKSMTGNQNEFRPLLKKMFMSREFYAKRAIGMQIKSPVQWLVGSARALEAPLPGPDASVAILRALGQELFEPPNVKGWDGGYAWISTTRLLHRYNLAGLLVKGADEMGAGRFGGRLGGLGDVPAIVDVEKVLPPAARTTRDAVQQLLQWRVYQMPIREKDANSITEYLSSLAPPPDWTDGNVRDILHLMMSTPEFQLC